MLVHSTTPIALANSGIFGNSSLRRDTGFLRPLQPAQANIARAISFSHNPPLGTHCVTRLCRWLYATTKRTDWKFVVVSNLLARAEVSFGVNDNFWLVGNLYDLGVAIWLAAVIDEACQVSLQKQRASNHTMCP